MIESALATTATMAILTAMKNFNETLSNEEDSFCMMWVGGTTPLELKIDDHDKVNLDASYQLFVETLANALVDEYGEATANVTLKGDHEGEAIGVAYALGGNTDDDLPLSSAEQFVYEVVDEVIASKKWIVLK